jgi:hypothetical protein
MEATVLIRMAFVTLATVSTGRAADTDAPTVAINRVAYVGRCLKMLGAPFQDGARLGSGSPPFAHATMRVPV